MSHPPNVREPIPGYILQERIGVGGYGEVWSAQAPGDLAKAVKLVYGHFDDARATRELKALKRIKEVRHPFLLSLERIEIIDGQLIIVTELADRSLKDRFEEAQAAGACIVRDELLSYLRDAADALDYMSENFSLQHLDVKPENLLLVGNRIKVADFGLVKELQDVTASMMGGLTPVYASPEVFDGRPSQRSDQYSLAIVYQEMLTGVLPFPGKTAAQLASQHVHARPRLTPLPAEDQPIVARALSKDPAQRFTSCRELIDSLAAAQRGPHDLGQSPDGRRHLPADSISDTTSVRSRAVETDHQWRQPSDGTHDATRSASVKTMVIGEATDAAPDEERTTSVTLDASAGPLLPPAAPVATAVDLPPLDLVPVDATLRPTLFVAVGGTGAQTLRQLRRQLHDRLGSSASLPSMQMLAIDTDLRSLYQATQGDCETSLTDHETMALPLRSAREYTSMPSRKLQSLSRRWLYNIPRSLQTEGRRPLGRLAFVDHAEPLFARLRSALSAISSAEAMSATAQATAATFASNVPRVFVVASISGGTGGGMVVDLAYALRTMLAELGFDDDGLCGILIHGTDRNPTAADLAIANAYATLSEMYHYAGPRGYPGDDACGLPPFAPDAGVFPHAYLAHLGDNLNEQDFDRGTDALASYLYLNAFTPAALAFDECRKRTSAADGQGSLRTLGLARVGSLRTSLPTLATEFLCREVVDRWRGTWKAAVTPAARTSLVELASHRGESASAVQGTNRASADQLAAEHAEQLELDYDRLTDRVGGLVDDELGGKADAILARMCDGIPPQQDAHSPPYVQQALAAMDGVFGPSDPSESSSNGCPAPIQLALEDKLKQLAAPAGAAVRDWLYGLVEISDARVAMASSAKQWYDKHLRAIESQAHEHLREKQRDLLSVEQAVKAAVAGPPKRGLFGRHAKRANAEITSALTYLVAVRCELATAQALARTCRLIAAAISAAGERIADLQRELGVLSKKFVGEPPWSNRVGEPHAGSDITASIAEALRLRMPELVRSVDERVRADFLEPEGGLRNTLERADSLRASLVRVLRAEARSQVLQTLKATAI
ncbi:MAG: tubulin-like doman-containing protein, partial [Pirellulales bacterium]